jgi:Rhamnan synthesis protein F
MRRLIVTAHWDPDGRIAPHVRRSVDALRQFADDHVFVSATELQTEDLEWVSARTRVLQRPNRGYDFASYKLGLQESELDRFDEVVIMNDSVVFPLIPPPVIFETMQGRACDFWGLTMNYQIRPHVQSFFVCFRRDVVASHSFRAFWAAVGEASGRNEAIQRYEIGLSTTLLEAGFSMDGYFAPTPTDRLAAAVRTAYLDVGYGVRTRSLQTLRDRVRTGWGRASWNVTIVLADRALDCGRLPFVKLETLRFDPNRLDGHRLLGWCEQEFPDEFADVRDYLERTDRAYGGRWGERRRAIAPFLPHYGRPIRAKRCN